MFVRISRALSHGTRREEGSTLVSVLIIMLILTVGGLVLANIVINTMGSVSTSRGNAESRAAADAGLADVSTMIQRGEIDCVAGPAGSPAVVLPTVSSTASSPVTYSVEVSCEKPTNGKTRLKLLSTGIADGGETTTTEAIYGPGLVGAITSYTKGLYLSGLATQTGDILVNAGTFRCDHENRYNPSIRIMGDVIVRNGDSQVSGGCQIVGDLITFGDITFSGNSGLRPTYVEGDVYALNSESVSSTFRLASGTKVDGNVYVKGDAHLSAGSTVTGDLVATGMVVNSGGTVIGSIQQGSTKPIATPWQLAPSAAQWVDVLFPTTSPAPACPDVNYDMASAIALLSSYTSPTIVDWRGCETKYTNRFIQISSANPAHKLEISLRTDVTIYTKSSLLLEQVHIRSADGLPHQFNVVVPDSAAPGPIAPPTHTAPTACGTLAFPIVLSIVGTTMDPLISGAAYSPCELRIDTSVWNGIIYSANPASFLGSTVEYRDLVLPDGTRLRQPIGEIVEMKDVG